MREKLMNEIRAHVSAEYPNEACGLIVETGTGQRFIPSRNIADKPADTFTLSPDDYLAATELGDVIMVIHSHPDVVQLVPSEMDRIQCDHSGVEWGIMSWPDGDFCTLSPRGDRELAGRRWVLGHADCWSLIMDYYRTEHGIIVNNYSVDREWWVNGEENLYDDNWQAEGFVEVDASGMRPGDMIMMRVQAPVTNHAAIYLGENIMVHHLFGNLSARVPYGKYYRDRTVRVVRRKELMHV
ncbi:proteasome lid subunit RPN8/RPN11 [Rahnella sp. BIGb0236]|uniref:C40 family peptidase n=1 Tax=Rahnella sp. BIGb0236 TaxID=2485117 RepID=UPI00105DF667|nr:C40 family peptidase [Rahnella sp. BIGb0236]TDS97748.1 proteasome lid subunit RPN8/RPN11 [Rahnella sp. BIGb0236]